MRSPFGVESLFLLLRLLFRKAKSSIGQNCCCEYSLTEIYDFPELATVRGCYIFRVICKNLYLEVLFSVYFFSERNTQYYFIVTVWLFCLWTVIISAHCEPVFPLFWLFEYGLLTWEKRFTGGWTGAIVPTRNSHTENMKSNGSNVQNVLY